MNNLMVEAVSRKTYHIDRTLRRMAGGWSAVCFVAAAMIFIFQVKVVNGNREALAAIILMPGLFLLLIAMQWQVVVTPSRFEYNLFPFVVKVAWADMIRFQAGQGHSLFEIVYRRANLRRALPEFILRAVNQGKIDITVFLGRWYEDGLGGDFRHFAPHLFSDDASADRIT